MCVLWTYADFIVDYNFPRNYIRMQRLAIVDFPMKAELFL